MSDFYYFLLLLNLSLTRHPHPSIQCSSCNKTNIWDVRETISAKNERSWQWHINHILTISKVDELHQLVRSKKILKIFAHGKMTDPPQISNPIKGIAQSILVTSDTEIKERPMPKIQNQRQIERGKMAVSAPVPIPENWFCFLVYMVQSCTHPCPLYTE